MSPSPREDAPFHLLGRPTPLLGRERELALLAQDFQACLDGSARVALVTGPAGGGKSRLRHELLRAITAAHPEVEVWTGRGNPMRAGAPFSVLAPALRHGLGLLDGEPADVLRTSLLTRLGLLFSEEDQVRVAVFLGELLGLPFPEEESILLRAARQDSQLMGHQLRQAWVELLSAECALRPILIVLEDVHWADTPSLAFLDFALAEVPALPWMAVALGQPEARALCPELWTRKAARELPLAPLPLADHQARAREALGPHVDGERADHLAELARGNMRQLEELIRLVAAGGAEVPDSAEDLSQARLAALPEPLRRAVSAASIFGRSFRPGGVHALLAATPLAEVRGWLGELAARELVSRRDEGLPGEEEWGFRNDGLREAAYASLPAEEREAWHRLAGEWLVAQGEADGLATAEHFDRGRAPEHARAAFLLAARQALNAGDCAAAISRAERGLAHGASGVERGAFRLVQAEAHRCRGEADLAGKRATEALGYLAPGSAAWFRAMEEAITAMGRQGGYQRVSAWTRQAMSVRPAHGAVSAQVVCLCAGARHLYQSGSDAFARDVLRQMEAADVDALAPLAAAQLHRLMAARARHEGNLSGDLRGYQAAQRAFERAGDARSACNARVSAGFALLELGDYARGEVELREALATAERLRVDAVATRARQNLALVLAFRGELEQARALAGRVIGESLAQGSPRFAAWTRIYLATIAAAQGDFTTAEAEGRAAADYFKGSPPARAGALAAQARGLLGLRRLEEARDAVVDAMRVFQTMRGIEEFEAQVRLVTAEVQWAAGDQAQARDELVTARARLLERADDILDATWRKSFLENVPENVRTLKLAAEWNV